MSLWDKRLSSSIFALATLVVLLAPWLFGAWEAWWFWPFVTAIAATGTLGCVRLALGGLRHSQAALGSFAFGLLAALAPFLIYALIRSLAAPVSLDAERSFMLQLTPLILGFVIVLQFDARQVRRLGLLIAVNLFLLGSYGLVNHYFFGNTRVLWEAGYAQYQIGYARATGTYYCPDHFSGLMELAVALGLGLLLDRNQARRLRAGGAALVALGVWGVLASRSRGGGLTLLVLAAGVLIWGLAQWRPRAALKLRLGLLLSVALMVVALALFGGNYVKRFKEYPWSWEKIELSERYQMTMGALRGWQSAPWFGIGPGMHQNLWPHFAASADGNRKLGVRPKYPNTGYHSYEAHNDWAQFLEEYGLTGLVLFLVMLGGLGRGLYRGWRRELRERRYEQYAPTGRQHHALTLAALLAAGAFCFHSFGDFNLQIPATVWLLATLIALPLALIAQEQPMRNRRDRLKAEGC